MVEGSGRAREMQWQRKARAVGAQGQAVAKAVAAQGKDKLVGVAPCPAAAGQPEDRQQHELFPANQRFEGTVVCFWRGRRGVSFDTTTQQRARGGGSTADKGPEQRGGGGQRVCGAALRPGASAVVVVCVCVWARRAARHLEGDRGPDIAGEDDAVDLHHHLLAHSCSGGSR